MWRQIVESVALHRVLCDVGRCLFRDFIGNFGHHVCARACEASACG